MRLNLSLGKPTSSTAVAPAPMPAAVIAATGATAALAVEHLTFHYGRLTALEGVSFEVGPGEILGVLGASGSGKSTLLRLIAGVERPAAGRIVLEGAELAGPRTFVPPERRRIGMVFQDYALFPNLTVAANVAFGLRGQPKAAIQRTVASLLDRVGLSRYAASYPHMLSGGERQRVALARALAPQPRLLLMDEPFSSLDGTLRDSVREQTLDLLRETRTTTIIVTHDPQEAMRMTQRIALFDAGRLVQCDPPEVLYRQPAAACAARLFGDVNEVRGACHDGYVDTPIGRFTAPAHAPSASVFIRPQHVRVSPDASCIAARVVKRTFLGDADQIVLDVAGLDRPIVARVAGARRLMPGDVVHIDVRPEDALVVPHDARGVPLC